MTAATLLLDESKQVAHMTFINTTYIYNRISQGRQLFWITWPLWTFTHSLSHQQATNCLVFCIFHHQSCCHCTPECMSSCHKELKPINQVGAENRRRKCAHVPPPSLNNGHREAQAADRTLTHIWPLPDGMSRWPLKRLEGPCASCSTSPPCVPWRRTVLANRIGVGRPGRKVRRLLGKVGVPGRGYPAFHKHVATSVKMHASPEVI